ncbi:MAG: DUF1800 domain-containing protein [Gaiellaceae bacterium MAG52_C11]|nr:DUF1800 domain-containing protein [Candidatus Gaiellasilicea maunaloa]
MSGAPVYRGSFGPTQAERLLWRAGFGPRPGESSRLAKQGLRSAVRSLVEPPALQLSGPEAQDDRGHPLAPRDAFGHDHLWWLDRMVRTNQPLVERMTLVWHDWFATSLQGVKSQALMLDQNKLFRENALGSFRDLLLGVTKDPAMLVWLSGNKNTVRAPNENYGRELMELFTLGADRGYSEQDVREQARALTGWRGNVKKKVATDFAFVPRLHDRGQKTIFGKSGAFDWQDSCRLCLEHPSHSSFFVRKLWSYFVPTMPSTSTQAALEQLYRAKRGAVKPVVEAILLHPDLHTGPRMVKQPVVYTAGLLRARGRGIDTAAWWKLDDASGQRLFYPPDVAGWDESRWLDTATFRGRWFVAMTALGGAQEGSAPRDPARLVARAISFWGSPEITGTTRSVLTAWARKQLGSSSPALVESALRQLVATAPELQAA